MNLTSFGFFVFLIVTIVVYYSFKPIQKYTLLVASLYFYFSVSSVTKWKLCLLIITIGLISYLGAIVIEKAGGKLRNILLAGSILLIVSLLFVLKYAYNVITGIKVLLHMSFNTSWMQFAFLLGISYYSLTAMGYIIEVYWNNQRASKNPIDVFLFVFYFPQLISGPLTRYEEMRSQFSKKKSLSYDKFTLGLRRMLFGYFKKLVISERFAVVVASVYGEYSQYSMVGIIGATICYAIQLYTDFSGCMDIVIGTSLLFGIDLPENFAAPFFSETVQEFWQRWHITLGLWFKDYVMYPIQKSKGIQKIGKVIKKAFGKKIGRKIPFYISMIILWICIGMWHGGTGYYFIASAGIPCIYILIGDIFRPLSSKITRILRINVNCDSWRWFRRIRTFLLICVCWMVVCSAGTHSFFHIVAHMVSKPINYTLIDDALAAMGLGILDVAIMMIGLIVLFFADLCVYKGNSLFDVMNKQNYLARLTLIYLEVALILFHGMVGESSFIYFKF